MVALSRYTQQIFASMAGNNQLSEYGSFIGAPPGNLYSGSTITPAIVQGLGNYLEGLYAAVGGSYSPTIQDHNSLFYLMSYQLSYLLEKGIPEWDTGTTYYTNDYVRVGEKLYISLTDNNINNAVTNPTYWQYPDNYSNTVTSNGDISVLNGDISVLNGNGLSIWNNRSPTPFYNRFVSSGSMTSSQDYTLPLGFPSVAGEALTSDTSGNLSFSNLKEMGVILTSPTNPVLDGANIAFSVATTYNYSGSPYVGTDFICPVSGYYRISYNLIYNNVLTTVPSGNYIYLVLQVYSTNYDVNFFYYQGASTTVSGTLIYYAPFGVVIKFAILNGLGDQVSLQAASTATISWNF